MRMYLTNGASSQRGIFLSGGRGSVSAASYAYRKDGRIECKTGSPKELRAFFAKQRRADDENEDESLGRVALIIIVPILLIVAAALLAQNGFQVTGIAVFAVISAFPCFTLSLVGNNGLPGALYEQLRRHHGAEHTLFAYYRKNKKQLKAVLTAQDLHGYRYLDRECGTVWMASIVIWAAGLGVAIALVPLWGVVGAIKLVAAVTVVLLLNTYANPVNPLVNIQKPEVAPPTEAELEVAAAAYNALRAALNYEDEKAR